MEQSTLFFHHFNSQGWKIGKNPMKNWKSALTGWINRSSKNISKVDKALANTNTDVINLLWKRMTEIYGHKWVSSYGTEPSKPWIEMINRMSVDAIKGGLELILAQGMDWPPSLPEFNKMCLSRKRIDCKPVGCLMIGQDLKDLRQRTVNAQSKFMSEFNKIIR